MHLSCCPPVFLGQWKLPAERRPILLWNEAPLEKSSNVSMWSIRFFFRVHRPAAWWRRGWGIFFLEENHLCLEHYFALPPVVERASSLKYLAFLRINANASDEKKVSVAGGKGVGKCSNLIGQRRNLRYIVGVNCSLTLVFRFSVNLQPPSFVFFFKGEVSRNDDQQKNHINISWVEIWRVWLMKTTTRVQFLTLLESIQ